MNLNAYISKSGYCSRRKAALLVKEGKVTVNGKVITEPWFEVGGDDRVKAAGRAIESQRHVYIIMNKPKGVTSTLEDRFASKKIIDLIPAKYGRVYPVGRLDKESRGLIVLTNDGDLCYTMTHPKFGIEKEYVVTIKGEGGPAIVKKLKKGVKDEEDILKVKDARILKSSVDKTIVRVIVCEGKKRHLRRLFMRLGLDVVDLVRVRVGGLRLGELRDGRFKIIDKASLVAALSSKPSTVAAEKGDPETSSE